MATENFDLHETCALRIYNLILKTFIRNLAKTCCFFAGTELFKLKSFYFFVRKLEKSVL